MLSIHQTAPEIARTPCQIAVLPVGAVEQHGDHLPVGTDLLLARALAEPIAKRLDAYLLPPLPITCSIEHRKAKGSVYLKADTLAQVVRDIAASLRDSGFSRLILVNFHGGNWVLKPTIREINRERTDFRAILLQPDLPAKEAAAIFQHPVGDVHGGEYETSLMLHLYPEEVRKLPAPSDAVFPPQSFLDYFDITDLTPAGHWGWPEAATAAKGERAMKVLVETALALVARIEETGRRLG